MTENEPYLQLFEYGHLPERLQAVSKRFHDQAWDIVETTPRNAQRTTALVNLLLSKDAAVRASIWNDKWDMHKDSKRGREAEIARRKRELKDDILAMIKNLSTPTYGRFLQASTICQVRSGILEILKPELNFELEFEVSMGSMDEDACAKVLRYVDDGYKAIYSKKGEWDMVLSDVLIYIHDHVEEWYDAPAA
jgi:hypothetical protein